MEKNNYEKTLGTCITGPCIKGIDNDSILPERFNSVSKITFELPQITGINSTSKITIRELKETLTQQFI